MKLISCEQCGVVLDTDRIAEPSIYTDDDNDGIVSGSTAAWDNSADTYKPTIECPACETRIFYHNGEEAD